MRLFILEDAHESRPRWSPITVHYLGIHPSSKCPLFLNSSLYKNEIRLEDERQVYCPRKVYAIVEEASAQRCAKTLSISIRWKLCREDMYDPSRILCAFAAIVVNIAADWEECFVSGYNGAGTPAQKRYSCLVYLVR